MTPELREYKRKWREENREKNREYQRNWRIANLEKERESKRRWRAENPEKSRENDRLNMRRSRAAKRSADPEKFLQEIRIARKMWRDANLDFARESERAYEEKNRCRIAQRRRAYKRRIAYGLTAEQFQQMLESQGNKCAICSATTSGSKRDWHVDHCHKTLQVRGILCHHCNLVLGYAKDSTETLRSAIEYLRRFQ